MEYASKNLREAVDAAGGEQAPKAGRGQPCILKEEDYARIYKRLKDDPFVACDEMIAITGGPAQAKRCAGLITSRDLLSKNIARHDNFLETRNDFATDHLVFVEESSAETTQATMAGPVAGKGLASCSFC